MGEASYVLGVKILRDRSRRLLDLSQEIYIRRYSNDFRYKLATLLTLLSRRVVPLVLACVLRLWREKEDSPSSLFKCC